MKCFCGNEEFVQDEFITNFGFEKSDDEKVMVRQDTISYYFCKKCGLMYFGPIFEKNQGIVSAPEEVKVNDDIDPI